MQNNTLNSQIQWQTINDTERESCAANCTLLDLFVNGKIVLQNFFKFVISSNCQSPRVKHAKISCTEKNNYSEWMLQVQFFAPWIVTFQVFANQKPFAVTFENLQLVLRVAKNTLELKCASANAMFEQQVPVAFLLDSVIRIELLHAIEVSKATCISALNNSLWKAWSKKYGWQLKQVVKWNMAEVECSLVEPCELTIEHGTIVVNRVVLSSTMVLHGSFENLQFTITVTENASHAKVLIEFKPKYTFCIANCGPLLSPFGITVPNTRVNAYVLCAAFTIRMKLDTMSMKLVPIEEYEGTGFEAYILGPHLLRFLFHGLVSFEVEATELTGFINAKRQLVIRTNPHMIARRERYIMSCANNTYVSLNTGVSLNTILKLANYCFLHSADAQELGPSIAYSIAVDTSVMELTTSSESYSATTIIMQWNLPHRKVILRKQGKLVPLLPTTILFKQIKKQFADVTILFAK